MKQILVVYSWISKYGNGFGNVDASCNWDVPSLENIRDIERQIRENYSFDNVVVLNIINLADKQSEERSTENAE
jgi:hypothetical protein